MRPHSGIEWRVWYLGVEEYVQNRYSTLWVMRVDAIGDDIMMDSHGCKPSDQYIWDGQVVKVLTG